MKSHAKGHTAAMFWESQSEPDAVCFWCDRVSWCLELVAYHHGLNRVPKKDVEVLTPAPTKGGMFGDRIFADDQV